LGSLDSIRFIGDPDVSVQEFALNMSEVSAVAIKLPTFWTTQPAVWFTQAEAQFHIRNITEDTTKYYHVVSALDQATASRVLDVLSSPPAREKYKDLKEKLLATYGLSRRERASRLLHLNGLGDQKPSELMDSILSLLDDHKLCLLAEQIFLEQLPEDICLQLADCDFTDPRAVALRADTLLLAKQQSTTPAIHRVKALNDSKRPKPSSQQNVCFYHARFGDQAHKCRSPCRFSGNEHAGRHQLQ